MLETALEQLIEAKLLPAPNKGRDILSAGPQAPLGTFSAKIDAAFQLGLISKPLARDLHLVRRIRNDFAHDPGELTFETPAVSDRVRALEELSDYNARHPETRDGLGPVGTRWDFLGVASWMLYHLQAELAEVKRVDPAALEFGYIRFEDLPPKVLARLEHDLAPSDEE
jgi:hypothetical protein